MQSLWSLWSLLCVLLNWDIDGRVRGAEAVGYPPFSVPSESRAPVVVTHGNVRSVLFEVLLDCGKDLLLVAAAFAC